MRNEILSATVKYWRIQSKKEGTKKISWNVELNRRRTFQERTYWQWKLGNHTNKSSGIKNQILHKIEKTPQGIYKTYKCVNFRPYQTIHVSFRTPQRCLVNIGSGIASPEFKSQNFRKTTPSLRNLLL